MALSISFHVAKYFNCWSGDQQERGGVFNNHLTYTSVESLISLSNLTLIQVLLKLNK